MSINAVRLALSAPVLPPARKLALVKLAYHCNDEGKSLFLSIATIARAAGTSRSQAQRHVRALIDNGLLSVLANGAGGKPGTVPHYHLHIDRLQRLATDSTDAAPTDSAGATGLEDGSHGCDGTGRMDAMGGVAPMRETGSAHATQSVIKGHLTVIERSGAVPDGPDRAAPVPTPSQIWSAGKSLLEAQGQSRESAATFIGGLISRHKEPVVFEAIKAAMVKQPQDAKGWLVATCKALSTSGSMREANKHMGFATKDYSRGFGE